MLAQQTTAVGCVQLYGMCNNGRGVVMMREAATHEQRVDVWTLASWFGAETEWSFESQRGSRRLWILEQP